MADVVKQIRNPRPLAIRFQVFTIIFLVDGVFVNLSILHDQREVLFRVVEEREILHRVAVDQENVGKRTFLDHAQLARSAGSI